MSNASSPASHSAPRSPTGKQEPVSSAPSIDDCDREAIRQDVRAVQSSSISFKEILNKCEECGCPPTTGESSLTKFANGGRYNDDDALTVQKGIHTTELIFSLGKKHLIRTGRTHLIKLHKFVRNLLTGSSAIASKFHQHYIIFWTPEVAGTEIIGAKALLTITTTPGPTMAKAEILEPPSCAFGPITAPKGLPKIPLLCEHTGAEQTFHASELIYDPDTGMINRMGGVMQTPEGPRGAVIVTLKSTATVPQMLRDTFRKPFSQCLPEDRLCLEYAAEWLLPRSKPDPLRLLFTGRGAIPPSHVKASAIQQQVFNFPMDPQHRMNLRFVG